jgi:hypothetical protein
MKTRVLNKLKVIKARKFESKLVKLNGNLRVLNSFLIFLFMSFSFDICIPSKEDYKEWNKVEDKGNIDASNDLV